MSPTPEIEAFIAGRVASERFRSAGEMVCAAVQLLEQPKRRQGNA